MYSSLFRQWSSLKNAYNVEVAQRTIDLNALELAASELKAHPDFELLVQLEIAADVKGHQVATSTYLDGLAEQLEGESVTIDHSNDWNSNVTELDIDEGFGSYRYKGDLVKFELNEKVLPKKNGKLIQSKHDAKVRCFYKDRSAGTPLEFESVKKQSRKQFKDIPAEYRVFHLILTVWAQGGEIEWVDPPLKRTYAGHQDDVIEKLRRGIAHHIPVTDALSPLVSAYGGAHIVADSELVIQKKIKLDDEIDKLEAKIRSEDEYQQAVAEFNSTKAIEAHTRAQNFMDVLFTSTNFKDKKLFDTDTSTFRGDIRTHLSSVKVEVDDDDEADPDDDEPTDKAIEFDFTYNNKSYNVTATQSYNNGDTFTTNIPHSFKEDVYFSWIDEATMSSLSPELRVASLILKAWLDEEIPYFLKTNVEYCDEAIDTIVFKAESERMCCV